MSVSDRYDFANLSPIEFEGLCADLVASETGLRFETFAEGPDGGVDGRHGRADGDIIIQTKHYKNSSWSDLQKAVKAERKNVALLGPSEYYLLTSQALTPKKKEKLISLLDHPSVDASRVWGRTELNGYLAKHSAVERRHIKLWLSSAAVLDRLLKSDIAVFSEATVEEIERILNVFVVNPSLNRSAEILKSTHCLIISGPPGVGKTTLAQVLAADYSEEGWELVSVASIDNAFRAFRRDARQVFVFDDFLGKIRLDAASLARDDGHIARFMSVVLKDKTKRFILTTRAYILNAARELSEALDDKKVELSEMVLDLATYTRELKARILYNHLYHSEIDRVSIDALLEGDVVRQIVDHRNYMPRIIQWMTDEIMQRHVAPSDYPKAFLDTLANPEKIWEKAFKQHISGKAQILLHCMFLSEQERYSNSGIKLDTLRGFFNRAIIEFGTIKRAELRGSIFEETLREVKSSFVVIENDKANFINPSVQDYLSRESSDVTVAATLAGCVPTVSGALSIWKKLDFKVTDSVRHQVAVSLLEALSDSSVSGKLALHELAGFVGELVLKTGDADFCRRLRKQGLDNLFWTVTAKLPMLVGELETGVYSHLPHAKAYARYLRLEVYRYVSSEREYAMEIEELSELATNLVASPVEMSEEFYRNFKEAAEEAGDALELNSIGKDEDAEQVIGEWLDHFDKIESLTSTSAFYWKRKDFEERLASIQQMEEFRQQMEERRGSTPRSQSSGQSRPAYDRGFSNEDLRSMFSSLKKR
ncbi:restriction endonuclease [Rhizobium sp. BK418]|uniref:nSTAND3 domain-containing NTPase n=1 Tax=Rhizobium sp. BK418 TaxID=2512120 RepID=UPI0010489A0E|nr:restriction endonuclease [Rhizobium sp. BK418]TCR97808.1 restriction endonuclease [Rhizobium sp. BK418]